MPAKAGRVRLFVNTTRIRRNEVADKKLPPLILEDEGTITHHREIHINGPCVFIWEENSPKSATCCWIEANKADIVTVD